MPDKPTFADWAELAARDLRDTPVERLNRDYGDLLIRPAYFPDAPTTNRPAPSSPRPSGERVAAKRPGEGLSHG